MQACRICGCSKRMALGAMRTSALPCAEALPCRCAGAGRHASSCARASQVPTHGRASRWGAQVPTRCQASRWGAPRHMGRHSRATKCREGGMQASCAQPCQDGGRMPNGNAALSFERWLYYAQDFLKKPLDFKKRLVFSVAYIHHILYS